MFILPSALDGIGGNGAKAYQCIVCGGLITHSAKLRFMPRYSKEDEAQVWPYGLAKMDNGEIAILDAKGRELHA